MANLSGTNLNKALHLSFASLFELNTDALLLLTLEGIIIEPNAAFLQMT